jgi:hypothetical protein
LARFGRIHGGNYNGIDVEFRNEGEYPAREVKTTKDLGKGFEPEPEYAAVDEAPPGGVCTLGFRIRRPLKDESNSWIVGQEETVRLKLTFRDGTGERDEAIFVVQMHNESGLWKP